MSFCIPKHLTALFKAKLKSGEITPEKLSDMTSDERREMFSSFLGKQNAQKVNELFESKLLLKNQQQGIINWAKQVAGMKPEVLRDIISRVNKMDKLLNPANQDAFLSDLAAHKLGVTVSSKEAANISALAKDVTENKQKALDVFKREDYSISNETKEEYETRLPYGRAKVEFDDYLNNLKDEAKKTKLVDYIKPSNYAKAIGNISGLAKSLKASLDDSVIGRQGLKVAMTHPDIWLKNSVKSFEDMARSFSGSEVLNEVRADVMSRENALNGLYKKEGVAVGVKEEAYPTNLPAKVPLLGRFFKASEEAFTAFQYRTRADIFDRYIDIAEKAGGDIKGIGQIANSLTGRGRLGGFEPVADKFNNVFFSPRLMKSNFDALTAHSFSKDIGSFARKEAAINTLKIIGGVAAILATAKAINNDSVEVDPRSADFGKIKIGDTRFDVTGGMSSIAILASRLVPTLWGQGGTKSSVTHLVTPINSGKFGSKNGVDVLVDFLENKASPAGGLIVDLLKGVDHQGNKMTFSNEAGNFLEPLPIANYEELKNDPNSANIIVAMLADELGVSTNTYSNKIDWSQKDNKEIRQFKDSVTPEEFKSANNDFNQRYNEWFKSAEKNPEYKSLPDDEKQEIITKQRKEIKQDVFRENNFVYKREHNRLPNIDE